MPIYEYQCECGSGGEKLLPLTESNQPQICKCGKVMERKMSLSSFVLKPQARQMAFDVINKRGNGQYQGMPHRWWKPGAERKAFAGTEKKQKSVW